MLTPPPPDPPELPVDHHDPPIEHLEPPVETPAGRKRAKRKRKPRARRKGIDPACLWPRGKALPTVYRRHAVPCPKCRRVLLDNRSQAVVVCTTGGGLAYLRCRACGHRFKLRVVTD